MGVLSLRTLLGSKDEQRVSDVMDRSVVAVTADTDQEEVAQLVERYGYLAVPVVDDADHLLGIVTVDDAMDAAEEEATEDIFITAGLSVADAEMLRSERILSASVPQVLKLRLPWLLVVLVGGLIAGGLVRAASRPSHVSLKRNLDTMPVSLLVPRDVGLCLFGSQRGSSRTRRNEQKLWLTMIAGPTWIN